MLDGQPSNSKEIAKACTISEESSYMRDYIRDASEEVVGIGFDMVKDK